MNSDNPKVILPLLVLTVVSQLFLFNVAYTNASFANGGIREEFQVRDYLAPAQIISPGFDKTLGIISDNLAWSFSTAVPIAGSKVASFFGLESYKFGMNRYTALANQAGFDTGQPQVLGAYQANPLYA